jgi:ankyrin repeat protein
MTALSSAVVHNYIACVEVLIQAGADVNCKDDRNFTPTSLAAGEGFYEVLRLLLRQSATQYDEKNADGYTPLTAALMNDHIDCVELLIRYGANVNVADHYGVTPLHIACEKVRCL